MPMRTEPQHLRFREIYGVARRRAMLLILPPVIISAICIVGSNYLPRLYESTIRILIVRAEVVNPLASLANAMNQTNDDPLKSFDEIIFSQRTYERLLDSLGLTPSIKTEVQKRAMMVRLRNSIHTKMQESESFSITFEDTDPVRAQRGASVLADIFINTTTSAKNQRNELTVDFYEKKLEEFRTKMDESQKQISSINPEKDKRGLGSSAALYLKVEAFDQTIREGEAKIKEYERALSTIHSIPGMIESTTGKQLLFEIQRTDVPYAADLRPLLKTYEDATAKYTAKHPEVVKVEGQIMDVIERMRVGIGTEIGKQRSIIEDARKSKTDLITEMMNLTDSQQEEREMQSNYSLYERLYGEMKVKLEEAEISRSLGSNLQDDFIVTDPALLPLFPSKPSRTLIVGGGIILGILMGLLSAIVAEVLDTTIRSPRAIEMYNKPVIALLPEAMDQRE